MYTDKREWKICAYKQALLLGLVNQSEIISGLCELVIDPEIR